jgi:APA family basic amino acid/polyamine antiporter
VCGFTGLCYAELASMIPIAGSAYTYTYATMGELIAWIIGWDLILEYAVSNMAVSVGFSAHLVGMFDWFGFHPALRWISPAYLPGGLTDLKGNVLYTPGIHFGFNFPAFLVVMILTVILVRGIRESAEANNVMVILKIAAILAFVIVGAHYVNPGNWHPFAPMGWSGPSFSSPTLDLIRSRPRRKRLAIRSVTCRLGLSQRWWFAPCSTLGLRLCSLGLCPGSRCATMPLPWSTQ